jgi:hypothetical protein
MPAGFNFTPSCRQRDIEFKNTGLHGSLTEALRSRIDDVLKTDLQTEYAQYRGFGELVQ